jgi:hypothetical protein
MSDAVLEAYEARVKDLASVVPKLQLPAYCRNLVTGSAAAPLPPSTAARHRLPNPPPRLVRAAPDHSCRSRAASIRAVTHTGWLCATCILQARFSIYGSAARQRLGRCCGRGGGRASRPGRPECGGGRAVRTCSATAAVLQPGQIGSGSLGAGRRERGYAPGKRGPAQTVCGPGTQAARGGGRAGRADR